MAPSTFSGDENDSSETAWEGSKSPPVMIHRVPTIGASESKVPVTPRHHRSPSPFEQTIQFRAAPDSARQVFTVNQLFNATPHRRQQPAEKRGASSSTSDEDDPSSLSSPLLHVHLSPQSSSKHGGLQTAIDEVFPSEPYYNKDFQDSLTDGIAITKKVIRRLEQYPTTLLGDPALDAILERAKKLSQFDGLATRVLGIVGDSGAGKSSLINSLLDKPGLARTGQQGSAVTSFVTEFRNKPKSQTAAFVVEVEYLQLEEIIEHLEEVLWSYRQPFVPEIGDKIISDDFNALERASSVAWGTLRAAFGDRHTLNPEWLKDFSDGAFERILAELCKWARDIEWPTGAESGIWRREMDSVRECTRLTKRFMKDRLWPFTKIMRIYLDAPVLNTGLVIADLPGYRDTNFARVKAARQYQVGCDELFIVSNISRAVTDVTIKAIIEGHMRPESKTAGPTTHPNITVVCTRAGDMNIKDAEKDYKKHINQQDWVHAKRQVEKAKRSNRYDERNRAETNRRYLFVAARNKIVTTKIQAAYAQHFEPETVPVFCIDNQDYQDEDFSFDIAATGIPRLRKFCYSVPAKALFRAANHFLDNLLPSLLQSLRLWHQTNRSGGRSQTISDLINMTELRKSLISVVDGWERKFTAKARDQIADTIWQNHVSFNRAAKDASSEWETWHPQSHKAYCQNNGNHSTKSRPDGSWNADLLEEMNNTLAPRWALLDDAICSAMLVSRDEMQSVVEGVIRTAHEHEAPTAFIQNLAASERRIEHIVDEQTEEFLKEFRTIKDNAMGGHETSYMMMQMRPTYKRCAIDSGSGTWDRCKGWIRETITRNTVFPTIRRAILCDMVTISSEAAASLKAEVESLCDGIENDLKTMRRPAKGILETNPGLELDIRELLERAEKDMAVMRRKGADARREAVDRGYIPLKTGDANGDAT